VLHRVLRCVSKEPEATRPFGQAPPPAVRILVDMVEVVLNLRFSLFLLVSSVSSSSSQVYNVCRSTSRRCREQMVDIYTMANPFTIVFFQLLITKLFGKWQPIKSIIVGIVIIGLAMAINVIPVYMAVGVRGMVGSLIPLGSMMIVLTVSLIAFGELFTSARTYEYIGSLAPKGQEGLFLGYANLPMAIGALLGGPAGAFIFNEIMCHGAKPLPSGLLELDPTFNTLGWVTLMVIGLAQRQRDSVIAG
jgi:dipeptide/tripeptide permease